MLEILNHLKKEPEDPKSNALKRLNSATRQVEKFFRKYEKNPDNLKNLSGAWQDANETVTQARCSILRTPYDAIFEVIIEEKVRTAMEQDPKIFASSIRSKYQWPLDGQLLMARSDETFVRRMSETMTTAKGTLLVIQEALNRSGKED